MAATLVSAVVFVVTEAALPLRRALIPRSTLVLVSFPDRNDLVPLMPPPARRESAQTDHAPSRATKVAQARSIEPRAQTATAAAVGSGCDTGANGTGKSRLAAPESSPLLGAPKSGGDPDDDAKEDKHRAKQEEKRRKEEEKDAAKQARQQEKEAEKRAKREQKEADKRAKHHSKTDDADADEDPDPGPSQPSPQDSPRPTDPQGGSPSCGRVGDD